MVKHRNDMVSSAMSGIHVLAILYIYLYKIIWPYEIENIFFLYVFCDFVFVFLKKQMNDNRLL